MYRFVWRITQSSLMEDPAALADFHARLLQDLQFARAPAGPFPVFRHLAAALSHELGTQPAAVGQPDEYFQTWVENASRPVLSARFAEQTMPASAVGGVISGLPGEPAAPPLLSSSIAHPLLLESAQSVPWSPPAHPPGFPLTADFCREPRPDLVARGLFVKRQRYLFDVADGILGHGVVKAWALRGGLGADVHVVDVEEGETSHESLTLPGPPPVDRVAVIRPGLSRVHGAAVMSVVCGHPALEGTAPVGILGMAPAVTPFLAATHDQAPGPPTYFDPSWAIVEALESGHLREGDVLLVEVNTRVDIEDPTGIATGLEEFFPLERFGDGWLASRLAVQRGVHVVHAACNSGKRLAGEYDSGAITVGALSPTGAPTVGFDSNHGPLVEVHAWGHCVASAGNRDSRYFDLKLDGADSRCYTFFEGTSAAAALVAGAVAAISGIAKAHDIAVSPQLMRQCLLDGGKRVSPDPNDRRRMLHVPGALAQLEQVLEVQFAADPELAGLNPDQLVARVAARFAGK